MAVFHTELNQEETRGEKEFYFRLKNKLSDEYHVWHNFHLHQTGSEIDFLIFHPFDGLFIIEVKDWNIDQIIEMNDRDVVLQKGHKSQVYKNPITQVKKYSHYIRNNLSKIDCLIHKHGHHKGNLVLPVNYGVVLSNIHYNEILSLGKQNFLPQNKILDKELVSGMGYTDKDYEMALKALIDVHFDFCLEPHQWNAIMAFLGTPVLVDENDEIQGVFDENQEMLVKYKIGSQILIEGPAGSGKSLVLIKRAIFIQQSHPDWKVGVFCYNVVMANFLKKLLENEDPDSEIIVSHFHGIGKAGIRKGTLNAVLVDEGQDINIKQLELISNLLDAPDSPVTIFYDNRQSLYESEDIHQMLSDCGFNIEYSKELVRQQRSLQIVIALAFYEKIKNPDKDIKDVVAESLSVSERFFKGYSSQTLSVSSGTKRFFSPDQNQPRSIADELGRRLIVSKAYDLNDILNNFIDFVKEKVETDDVTYNDFLIIYPKRFFHWHYPSAIKKNLSKHKIPFRIIDSGTPGKIGYFGDLPDFEIIEEGDNRNEDLNDNVVKAMTINQSKGIDAKYVAIMGFDGLNVLENDPRKAAELAYVGLTRAKEVCFVYYTGKTLPIEKLNGIIEEMGKY